MKQLKVGTRVHFKQNAEFIGTVRGYILKDDDNKDVVLAKVKWDADPSVVGIPLQYKVGRTGGYKLSELITVADLIKLSNKEQTMSDKAAVMEYTLKCEAKGVKPFAQYWQTSRHKFIASPKNKAVCHLCSLGKKEVVHVVMRQKKMFNYYFGNIKLPLSVFVNEDGTVSAQPFKLGKSWYVLTADHIDPKRYRTKQAAQQNIQDERAMFSKFVTPNAVQSLLSAEELATLK